jgi:adenine specific DNA methyltransferase (MFOKI)
MANLFSETKTFSQKKPNFLNSLKGRTLAYKRYTKSPLRYLGGKSLAANLP